MAGRSFVFAPAGELRDMAIGGLDVKVWEVAGGHVRAVRRGIVGRVYTVGWLVATDRIKRRFDLLWCNCGDIFIKRPKNDHLF